MADISDVKEMAVKHWPLLLGALIGLWLISRFAGSGGGGGESVNSGADAAAMGMQLEGMRIAANSGDTRYVADVQREIGMAGFAVEMFGIESEREVELYRVDSQRAVSLAQIQGQTYAAQLSTAAAIEQAHITADTTIQVAQIGGMVQTNIAHITSAPAMMSAYADVLEQMNAPTIAGINAATMTNIAAIGALTTIGTESIRLKGDMFATAMAGQVAMDRNYNETLADIIASTGYNMFQTTNVAAPAFYPQHITQIPQQSNEWGGVFAKLVAAYFTGGASLAATGV
jgi:hypothetical protein